MRRGSRRKFDSDIDSDDESDEEFQRPFRPTRNRRPHSRRRFKEEIENYPFRKRSSSEYDENIDILPIEPSNSTIQSSHEDETYATTTPQPKSNNTTNKRRKHRKKLTQDVEIKAETPAPTSLPVESEAILLNKTNSLKNL